MNQGRPDPKNLGLSNSQVEAWANVHICSPVTYMYVRAHACAHTHMRQAHCTNECRGGSRVCCNYLFILISSLIGL